MEDQKKYFTEIEKYIKQITGFNISLSEKDKTVLEKAYTKKLPISIIKKIIKEELKKYPAEKRKKFSLIFLEEKIKKIKKTEKKEETHAPKQWHKIVKKLNLPSEVLKTEDIPEELKDIAIENNILNYLWKSMKKNEKEKVLKEALEIMKKRFILTNINKEKTLKSVIREIIKEKYNIK